MNRTTTSLVGAVLLLLLTACSGTRPSLSSDSGTQQAETTGSQITPLPKIVVTPTLSITQPLELLPTSTGTGPSYSEIKEAVRKIVDDPTLTSREQDTLVGQYADTVVGKRVEGWVGWISDLGVFTRDEPAYNVNVYMHERPVGSVWPVDVTLFAVPRSQVEKLRLWQDLTKVTGPWQRARISGTIKGVGIGLMSLEDASLEPLD